MLTCSDEPYVLRLLKTDPEGAALPDASFNVSGRFAGGSAEESVQTDAQGAASLASLLMPGQTYTLAETAVPAGYQPLGGQATFTLGEDVRLQMQDDADGGVKVGNDGMTLIITDQRVVKGGMARTGDAAPIAPALGVLATGAVALLARLAIRRREE